MKIIRKINRSVIQKSKAIVDPNDPLTKARAKQKLRREAGEVTVRRNPREVWESDKKSMRKAINANCYDCIGEENYTRRIRYCDIFKCPFWFLRPYSKGISQEECRSWNELPGSVNEDSDEEMAA